MRVHSPIIILAYSLLLVSTAHAADHRDMKNVHHFTIQARGGWTAYHEEQTYTSYGASVVQSKIPLYNDNYNIELEGRFFATDYLSFSSSIGYMANQQTQIVGTILGQSTYDNNKIVMYPSTFMAQLHLLNKGDIRPYVGVGYHYTILDNDFEFISTPDNISGLVLQAGTDIWLSKRWGLNLDVKYYDMSLKADYSGLLNGLDYIAHIDVDPTTYSAGLSYRF